MSAYFRSRREGDERDTRLENRRERALEKGERMEEAKQDCLENNQKLLKTYKKTTSRLLEMSWLMVIMFVLLILTLIIYRFKPYVDDVLFKNKGAVGDIFTA